MAEKGLKSFFSPGPRGRLRWAIFGVFILFLIAAFLDVIGFENIAADKLDDGISRIPVLNQLRIWPLLENSSGSKRLVWKNIQEISLPDYGQPFRLGLDLSGGTHLVYQADTAKLDLGEKADALAGVRDVIERRVNALGVSEPLVQTNQIGTDWRVIVELAGVYDVNSAIKMIGETPLLEFKEEDPQAVKLTAEQQKQLDGENKKMEEKAQGVLQKVLAGDDFSNLAKDNSDDPGSKDNGGLYTGVTKGMFAPEFEDVLFNKLRIGETYPQLALTQFGYHIIRKEAERGEGDSREIDARHILFRIKTAQDLGVDADSEWKNTELTGQHLKKAAVIMDPNSGIPQVSLEFNAKGQELFSEITGRNVGKPVAIFLDNRPISIPRVNEAITSGQAVISGDFTLKEAKVLAQRLNAGALPVPINLISQTTVGAALGSESVQKSLIAGLWGLILVILFMILFYRLPGFLSVIALLVYTAVALVIFKLFSVTLTLAGIAGFILSIGMAVDANILISERLKEELKAGRDLGKAIDEGFRRAWSSIRDSNISSLITCAILFWFGSSIIRGFALTLAIGILVSMFSAVIISRQFLRLAGKWKISQHPWLYGVSKKKIKNNQI